MFTALFAFQGDGSGDCVIQVFVIYERASRKSNYRRYQNNQISSKLWSKFYEIEFQAFLISAKVPKRWLVDEHRQWGNETHRG